MGSASPRRPSPTGGPAVPSADRPVFWKEVYWFAIICLGGAVLALAVLPGRLARHRATLDLEEDLQAAVAGLGDLEKQYEVAIQAVENDPFYKEEVQRHRLGVKRKGETLLSQPEPGGSQESLPVLPPGAPTVLPPGAPTVLPPGAPTVLPPVERQDPGARGQNP